MYQWNDLDGTAGSRRGVRGGGWTSTASSRLSSSDSYSYGPSESDPTFGFRLASGGPSAVPEIDPNSLGSVLALVLGSLGLLERRRLKVGLAA